MFAKRPPRKPRLYEWGGSALFLVVGLAILRMYFSASGIGRANERDLLHLSGTPSAARIVETPGRYGATRESLELIIDGKLTQYDHAAPAYREIREELRRGEMVEVWISKETEAAIPGFSDARTLYAFAARGQQILSYEQSTAYYAKGKSSFLIVGGVLSALAMMGLAVSFRQRRLASAAPPPLPPARISSAPEPSPPTAPARARPPAPVEPQGETPPPFFPPPQR